MPKLNFLGLKGHKWYLTKVQPVRQHINLMYNTQCIQIDLCHFKYICHWQGIIILPHPLQTTRILHHLEIEQDVACIVDLTFDLMPPSFWPPTWPMFFCVCQLQLSCICSPSRAVWRSHLMTKSSSWPRALFSESPAPAQGRPRGSSKMMVCRTSRWNRFTAVVRATKLCKAMAQLVFWPCGTWTGSTQGCISAIIGTLEKPRRLLSLFQVRHDFFFGWNF